MSKLDVPKFKGPMSPAAIIQWLNRVTDAYVVFVAFNDDKKLTSQVRILYAGLAFEEEKTMAWWESNREDLKKLTKWDEFTVRVLARFAPDSWKAEAARVYYTIHQHSPPYSEFATELESARIAVGTTGGLTITDRIHINHLLFHAHNTLQRRVLALPGFDLEKVTVDELTSVMSTTWQSLIAERLVHMTTSIPVILSPLVTLPTPTASLRLPPLDDAERKWISDASGCWKCHKSPSSPGWTPHIGRTCPGDASMGILPGRDYVVVKQEPAATIFYDDAESQPPFSNDGEDQPDMHERYAVGYTEARVAADAMYCDGNNESDSDGDGY
ncbi:hypothetical protein B0H19DRAFT_1295858 [Mycena capillaripes]|nr:hypothetical protein B0H19DRAFT_1295858 [Mycena capillaripes]